MDYRATELDAKYRKCGNYDALTEVQPPTLINQLANAMSLFGLFPYLLEDNYMVW